MDWKELLFNEIKDLREETKAHALASKESSKEVEVRLQAIENDLKYHIKRTDILEESVKPIRNHGRLQFLKSDVHAYIRNLDGKEVK